VEVGTTGTQSPLGVVSRVFAGFRPTVGELSRSRVLFEKRGTLLEIGANDQRPGLCGLMNRRPALLFGRQTPLCQFGERVRVRLTVGNPVKNQPPAFFNDVAHHGRQLQVRGVSVKQFVCAGMYASVGRPTA
jgi:hypothetical protein